MATELDHISAYPIPPGEHLVEELEAREIATATFGPQIDLSEAELRDLIAGACPLTATIATALERTLELSAELWLGLEADYRSALATREAILRERSAHS